MTNVTRIDSGSSSPPTITLDSIVAEMKDWRAGKQNNKERIPNHLWHKIFSLADKHSAASIRPLLGISKKQYDRQYAELNSTSELPDKESIAPAEIKFCEVKSAPATHPAATQPNYPGDIPATNTVVVELYRADGKLMKIHTTTHRFKELLHAFHEGF